MIDAACDDLFVGEVSRCCCASVDSISANITLYHQTICLGIVGQDCTSTHTIATGDFCASIAADAGTNVSTLLSNNPNVNSDCSNIYPGEVSFRFVMVVPSSCVLMNFLSRVV